MRKGQRGSVWSQAALCSVFEPRQDNAGSVKATLGSSLGVRLLAGLGHDYGPPVSKLSSPSAAFHFSGVLGTTPHPIRIRLVTATFPVSTPHGAGPTQLVSPESPNVAHSAVFEIHRHPAASRRD